MARLTEEGVEQQKLQILQSALKVFNQKGFHGTKLKEVARVSGISRSPIYYHFTDKKTLYAAVIDFAVGKWFDNIMAISYHDMEIFDMIEAMLMESLNGEFRLSETFISELRLHKDQYGEAAERYFGYLRNTRALIADKLEEEKKKGNICEGANPTIISENLAGMSSGMVDMRRYFLEDEVRMPGISVESYMGMLVEEYMSCLRTRYKK